MNKNYCPICGRQHKTKKFTFNSKLKLISSNFKKINNKKNYYVCKNFEFIYAKQTAKRRKIINDIYKDFTFKNNLIKPSREIIIANEIKKKFRKNMSVLEIGPGNGELINCLSKFKNIINIDAYDINKNKFFTLNKVKKFKNLFINLNKIYHKYDLVIMNQVFFHLDKLDKTMNKISELLDDNGHLFLITPNPFKHKVIYYVYDIFSISSKKNIISYLNRYNLNLKNDLSYLLKNQISLIFKKNFSNRVRGEKFISKYKKTQISFASEISKLRHKKITINGMGLKGNFIFNNYKKSVFQIKDEFRKINKVFKKNFKKKSKLFELKTY
tara:strand:+ start:1518 stop:2498 length:981 start_codon:yes stop_codon:yes gene_type:complete